MKNTLFIACAQIITLADLYIFSLFRTSMKRNPSLLFSFIGNMLPAILFGTFLALSTWHESKSGNRTITGLLLVLINILLLVFQFKGYITLSSFSMSFSLILVGYGIGVWFISGKRHNS